MDVSNGHRRATQRGSSHRTSFIEYVSEVYNSRSGRENASDKFMEALSVRGQSISSGSVASGSSSHILARDLSVRSESTHSNRVLPGRHHTVRANKSSRIIGKHATVIMTRFSHHDSIQSS